MTGILNFERSFHDKMFIRFSGIKITLVPVDALVTLDYKESGGLAGNCRMFVA